MRFLIRSSPKDVRAQREPGRFLTGRWILLASVLFPAAFFGNAHAQSAEPRSLGAIDVQRIGELHHLTTTLGERLWPGFDTRNIPIAINCHDRQELLAGHPSPPEVFREFKGHSLNGRPVMIRDGCTRYGPSGGGWSMKLGGEETAYVGVLRPKLSTEGYLSLLLHECFHVFQPRFRKRSDGPRQESPLDDPAYATLIGLESRILHEAVGAKDERKLKTLARMFVSVRNARRKNLHEAVRRNEDEGEFSEGTATYVQARMLQLLAKAGGIKPSAKTRDASYRGFAGAAKDYQRFVQKILPTKGQQIRFSRAQYNVGMAQGLVLDRLRPKWKKEIGEQGVTQFMLLERTIVLEKGEAEKLVAAAKK